MVYAVAGRFREFLAHDVLRFATLLAAAVFLLDWATKSWALHSLEHSAVPLGALTLAVERNDAFAFSAGAGVVPTTVVFAVRLVLLIGVLVLFARVGANNRRYAAGFALLIAGGAGNAADLLFRGGAVVDLIHAGPLDLGGRFVHAGVVFNGADLAILVAIGLLAPLIRQWSLAAQRRIAMWESRWLNNVLTGRGDQERPHR
jgi:lipoprotein signal peptidase